MEKQFLRTEMLLGEEAVAKLHKASVAVFGVGGVGGYVVEVLARSGIGRIDIFDNDLFEATNLNRQLHALHSTIGRPKVDVVAERVHDIFPECDVRPHRMFYIPETADSVDLTSYDFVIDCIDTVQAKLELARRCHHLGIPLIASMGAANKLDPAMARVEDISRTKIDPLARAVRQALRREGIYHLTVVYSEEQPINCKDNDASPSMKRPIPASCAFVPAAFGLILGGEVVKRLVKS